MRKLIIVLLYIIGPLTAVMAQRRDTAAVVVMGRAQQHSIMVRWGVNNVSAWKLANKYGFQLLRFTIVRGGKVLERPEVKALAPGGIKPRPLQEWEQIAQKDQYAAIIAQALYGKDFEVAGGGNSGVAKIVGQSQEQVQRFAFSLYAADHSFAAAKMAGWAWEDSSVVPGEKYLYRVNTLIPATKMRLDTSGVYIGLADYHPLPVPPDIAAIFGDKHVVLSWNYNILEDDYASWFVERSRDGRVFEKATAQPVANLNEKERKASPRMYFVDSLKDNTTIYYYRIRGVSPFGETGPPSKIVKGKGLDLLLYTPGIRSHKVDAEGVMTINWEFEEAGNALIREFTLNHAEKAEGPFTPVVTGIAPDQRSARYDRLKSTNYFTITAVAREGQPATSFPVMVQPVDSVPPAAPVGLSAVIDNNGIVKITWNKNTEPDMLGYKIFRGNRAGEEMSPLTDTAFYTNSYMDTVPVKSLNARLYYAVTALDQRYNQSAFSVPVIVKRPDVIPPSSPVFTHYRIENGAVKLSWARSHDEDVAVHILYRKEKEDTSGKWYSVRQFTDHTEGFADTEIKGGHTYSYIILAKDSSGLESVPAQPVMAFIPHDPEAMTMRSLSAYVHRDARYIELRWNDKIADVKEYQLYKGANGTMSLWKVLPAGTKMIMDDGVRINTLYKYAIRPVLKSGAQGSLKVIEVKY